MNSTDFLNNAPKFITSRFNSVNKYVWQTLIPEQTLNDKLKKYKTKAEKKKEHIRLKSISDEASIIVFLFFTKQVLC